jgi:hypothetical protein
MTTTVRLPIGQIEQQICDITSQQLAIPRNEVLPSSPLIEDLGCDSLAGQSSLRRDKPGGGGRSWS